MHAVPNEAELQRGYHATMSSRSAYKKLLPFQLAQDVPKLMMMRNATAFFSNAVTLGLAF